MNMLWTLVIVLQVIAALGVIVLVLLQHGKGADMGAAFGSGASGSLFGATGSANFLSHLTAVMAAIFFVTTLALAFLSHNRADAPRSVMDHPGAAQPAGKSATVPAPGGSSGPSGTGPATGEPASAAPSGTAGDAGSIPKDPVAAPSNPSSPANNQATPGSSGEIPK